MIRKRNFIFILSVFFGHFALAQSYQPKPLSLSQAIEQGLAANYNVQIAEYELERAQVNRMRGSSERFPSIDFSINQSNRLSRDNSPVSFTDGTYTKNEISGSLNTDWLIYGGNRVKIDNDRLKQIEKQKAGDSRTTVERTIKLIIRSYYKSLIEQEKLRVIAEARLFAHEKRKKAQAEYEAERISRFDLNNYKNDLLKDSIKFTQQEKKYTQSLIKLKTVIGYNGNRQLRLTDKLNEESEKYMYDVLEEEMLQNNLQLQNEVLKIGLLDNALLRKKASRKPTIKFKNSISDELNTSKFGSEERENGGILDISAQISLSYNIFDGGKYKNDLQQSKMDRIIADRRVSDLELKLKEQLQINLEEYHRQMEILTMKKKLAENLSENLTIAEDRLQNGYSIYIEYRDARIDLLEAELDIIQTIYDMKMAEIEVVQLIGGLLS